MKSGSLIKYGITIPSSIISLFSENTLFTLQVSGASIIMTSGASHIPTKQEVDNLDIDSFKVNEHSIIN